VETAVERLSPLRPTRLVGPGAGLLISAFPAAAIGASAVDPTALAALVAAADEGPAEPLYLRAPDAKLPAA
jgi:hypothetical protein